MLVTLFLVLAVFFAAISQISSERYHHEVSQKLHSGLAKTIVAHNKFVADGQLNPRAVHAVFEWSMSINPSIEIYLLDLHGNILGYSAPEGRVKRNKIALAPLKRFFDDPEILPIYGDDPRHAARRKIFSAAPIMIDNTALGYLYIILGGEKHQNVLQTLRSSHNQRLTLWILFAAMLFGLAAALIGFALLTRRLRKLVGAITFFEQSAFSARPNHLLPPIKAKNADEIDQLVTTFNEMADRIIVQVDQLKKAEKARRELTMNISHDLRTPLTSLRGYLETILLPDTKLTSEQRIHYLKIASRHCERLGKLIDELFELSTLDSPSTLLNKEAFDIGDLMSDIALKFQLRAEQNGVELAVSIADDLPHLTADISLIERAFDNLIENALRYTPAKGRIELKVVGTRVGVVASVFDTGTGIPEEEIPHVFDRYYRLKPNQKERSTRAGLGLAITQRIVELHGGVISAISGPKEGTRFTFDLPFDPDNKIKA